MSEFMFISRQLSIETLMGRIQPVVSTKIDFDYQGKTKEHAIFGNFGLSGLHWMERMQCLIIDQLFKRIKLVVDTLTEKYNC